MLFRSLPLLITKFTHRLERQYPTRRLRRILAASANQERFMNTPVPEFMDLFKKGEADAAVSAD